MLKKSFLMNYFVKTYPYNIFALLNRIERCPVNHVHNVEKQTKISWRGRNARREVMPFKKGICIVNIVNNRGINAYSLTI